MMWSVVLEAPGVAPLSLDGGGWFVEALDIGFPTPRLVAEDAPDMDGSIDTSRLLSSRTIVLSVSATPDVTDVESMSWQLKRFLSPRLRPTMRIVRADGVERVATLRGERWSERMSEQLGWFVAQWSVPSGVLEAAELSSVTVFPAATAPSPGMSFDASFDLSFGGGSGVVGAVEVTPAGTADVWPLMRIYGPCSDPSVEHVELGRQIAFSGLTIAAGDFVEVDTRAKTVRYNANPTDPRYSSVDWAVSSWWPLSPGVQSILFDPAVSTAPSQVVLEWHDAYL